MAAIVTDLEGGDVPSGQFLAPTATTGPKTGGDCGGRAEARRKQTVTERLRRRDEERMTGLQQRRADKEETKVAGETADYFRDQFNALKAEVDEGLIKGNTIDESARSEHFDGLVLLVQGMQKFLTDSAHFLPSFRVQSAQESINQSKEAIEEKRALIVPKKKFAFKGGKKKTAADAETTDHTNHTNNPLPTAAPSRSAPAHPAVPPRSLPLAAADSDLVGFRDATDATLSLTAGELAGRCVMLAGLARCRVVLHGAMQSLTVDGLVDCVLDCGPVGGSVFVDDCSRCQVSVACQQLRVHRTADTSFYLHVTSRAIIEDCRGVRFAPFSARYSAISAHFAAAGLDQTRNNWSDVDDFDWLASDAPSPNWSVLAPGERRDLSAGD